MICKLIRIHRVRNVSRSNFYFGNIRIYSFVFLFSRNTKLAEIGHGPLSFDHFAKLTKYKNKKNIFKLFEFYRRTERIQKHENKTCFQLFLETKKY